MFKIFIKYFLDFGTWHDLLQFFRVKSSVPLIIFNSWQQQSPGSHTSFIHTHTHRTHSAHETY